MMHADMKFPHPAPRPTLGGRGMADAASSPASATHEQMRREGICKMHRQLAAPRANFDQVKYADLRDGGLMPREPVDSSAILFWLLMLAGGCVFWIWALPKIIRAAAALIVIGANTFH